MLSVTRGVSRVGDLAWLNAMQQRRHKEMILMVESAYCNLLK